MIMTPNIWRESTGTKPSKINCGEHGWLTIRQIASRTKLTRHGVFGRLRRMKKFDVNYLLAPRRKVSKVPKVSKVHKVPEPIYDGEDPYLEGVAAHPDASCPYKPVSLPTSHDDRSQSPMFKYAQWWAGWHDADMGMV